jgi:membrane peptidoglycan carboxypeptidase
MAYYTSKFKLNNKRKSPYTRKWTSMRSSGKRKWLRINKAKFKKAFYVFLTVLLIVGIVGGVYLFGWLQTLTEQLPSPDKPFGQKSAASEIYDRNGKLLYRIYGDENRDPIKMEEVPQLMKWSLLAAEDIDFYKHSGVDMIAVIRCGIANLAKTSACGGSTITQQLIKQTALTNERSWERKIKEVILALEIEKQRSKDEILEMYLNVIPEGSNIYGIKRAAYEYFGKDLSELNLAQYAILASIPQDPNNLSPTRSANAESKQKVKDRQMYVLSQMEKYKDQINAAIKEETGATEDVLTTEMIDEARNFELVYTTAKKKDELKAPHFVFYVQKLLMERGYNNGEPFSKEALSTGGYKITTTLNLDYQEIAEEQVKEGVDVYGSKYGAENAALIAMNPRNGEILAMVGSKDYFGTSSPEGCSGASCKFAPEVNILDTLQSYGSSMKPMLYYYALEKGLISAGSMLPDVPIQIGNYKPKNYSNSFTGIRTARKQLTDSQNIPPIYMVDQLGVASFVEEMQHWGYTTLNDPRGYGPSIVVGGADVKLIEHAQAYGVLANEGKLVKHEAVLKIVDRDGNEVFNYQPQEEQVADPRGTFIINDILNANRGGPGVNKSNGGKDYSGWDYRDIAGKTGTSEDFKETLFATYTPEIVVLGWLGNNNNQPMSYGASGFGTARPWISKFVLRIGNTFPATPFSRPAGVVSKANCEGAEGTCEGVGYDLGIVDISVPSYVNVKPYTVCTDQPDHLARQIDIDMGLATTVNIKQYIMPNTKLQSYLDTYVQSKPELNGIVPTEYCTINRNPSGTESPWAAVSSPASGQLVTGGNVSLAFNAYTPNAGAGVTSVKVYLDNSSTPLLTATTLPYSGSVSIGTPGAGMHNLKFVVKDTLGNEGTTSVPIEILGTISISSSSNLNNINPSQEVTINYNYSVSGLALEGVTLYLDGSKVGTCVSGNSGTCIFTAPSSPGNYTLYVMGTRQGESIKSNEEPMRVRP